ncbi:hypothetical protein SAMN05428975_1213 [Mucilaginibacter sp. OK268]|jgi:hypothetical protein|uniref:hypothetical protein n=1 Tax=Mucilaginibacter sp. OK268 TaxID=1881048 RepID=UPI0008870D3B|nr:hypothetical protein [Mucilaginibacter sp. OK268]SDP43739.1 hypothetical protein SAMN05428975_1213 [Mucilaginibacter sp. OK268]
MERSNEKKKDIIDDVIEQSVQKNKSLLEQQAASRDTLPEYPEVYIPDYSKEFRQINEQLNKFNQNYEKENISRLFEQIDKKIDRMPDVIPVRHHLDPKSQWVLIIYFILIVGVAVLTGTTIGYATESYLLKEQLKSKQALSDDMGQAKDEKFQKNLPVRSKMKKKRRAHKTEPKKTSY